MATIKIRNLGRILVITPAEVGSFFENHCNVERTITIPASAENQWQRSRQTRDEPTHWYDTDKTGQRIFCAFKGYLHYITSYLEARQMAYDYVDDRPSELPDPNIAAVRGIAWRPRQSEVVANIMAHEGGVVVCPTAFGKSFIIKQLCKIYPTAKIVITCSAADVCHGIYADLKEGIDNVGFCGDGVHDPQRVTVAVSKSLKYCDMNANIVLVDECFVAGTPVRTPTGDVPIEYVRCGDIVCAAHGTGTVVATTARSVLEVWHVTLTDGTRITTTANHPFFTAAGWVRARQLESGQVLFSEKDLRLLRSGFYSDLFGRAGRAGNSMEHAQVLLKVLLEEATEPNAQRCLSGQDGSPAVRDRASAEDAWRQRNWAHEAPGSTVAASRRGLAPRVYCEDQPQAVGRISTSLQDRRGESDPEDCNRDRRRIALHVGEASAGPEEDGLAGRVRVASVAVEKLNSPRTVFNLSVSGHPSYYAGGVLVHNCHTMCTEDSIKQLNRFRRAKMFGFTATPRGRSDGSDAYLEALFGHKLADITYQEAVAVGNVVQLHVYTVPVPQGPSLTGFNDHKAEQKGLIWNKIRNDKVIQAVRWLEQKVGPEAQILVMVDKTEHAYLLGQSLPEYTIVTGVVDADRQVELQASKAMLATQQLCSAKDRDRYRIEFESGRLLRAIATRVWEKGVDFRDLAGLVRADGLRSPIAAGQIPGRLSRLGKATEKTHGIVVDFFDSFDDRMKRRSEVRQREYRRHGWLRQTLQLP